MARHHGESPKLPGAPESVCHPGGDDGPNSKPKGELKLAIRSVQELTYRPSEGHAKDEEHNRLEFIDETGAIIFRIESKTVFVKVEGFDEPFEMRETTYG